MKVIDNRQDINARLEARRRYDQLKGLAAQGDSTALSLYIWIADLCADLIYQPDRIAKGPSSWTAAAIHHLLSPSRRILPLIAAEASTQEDTWGGREKGDTFWIAQALAPTDGTVPALLDVAGRQPDALKTLYLLRDRLSTDDRRTVASLAQEAFTNGRNRINKGLALQV